MNLQVNSNEAEGDGSISRGREETDEECAKRRKFFERASGSGEGNEEGAGLRREAEKASGSQQGHRERAKVGGSSEGAVEEDVPHV